MKIIVGSLTTKCIDEGELKGTVSPEVIACIKTSACQNLKNDKLKSLHKEDFLISSDTC